MLLESAGKFWVMTLSTQQVGKIWKDADETVFPRW